MGYMTGATRVVPYHVVKSLQLIWRSIHLRSLIFKWVQQLIWRSIHQLSPIFKMSSATNLKINSSMVPNLQMGYSDGNFTYRLQTGNPVSSPSWEPEWHTLLYQWYHWNNKLSKHSNHFYLNEWVTVIWLQIDGLVQERHNSNAL